MRLHNSCDLACRAYNHAVDCCRVTLEKLKEENTNLKDVSTSCSTHRTRESQSHRSRGSQSQRTKVNHRSKGIQQRRASVEASQLISNLILPVKIIRQTSAWCKTYTTFYTSRIPRSQIIRQQQVKRRTLIFQPKVHMQKFRQTVGIQSPPGRTAFP